MLNSFSKIYTSIDAKVHIKNIYSIETYFEENLKPPLPEILRNLQNLRKKGDFKEDLGRNKVKMGDIRHEKGGGHQPPATACVSLRTPQF